jgi:hypothetical protein
MGSAVSKNITKAITESIANVSNSIIQSIQLTTDQTQIISVTDVEGDVVISGNTFTQKASINMKSLMNVLLQENVQQDLALQLAQACKSIVSGLNLFQFPNAQNEINTFLKASIELLNTINQTCMSSISENQTITVTRVKGNVYIVNNVMTEIANIIQSCVQDAVVKNSVFQKLQEEIDQRASATAEGLSLWQIIILIVIILCIPLVSVVGGVAVVGRFLFPLSLLIGVGGLVTYNEWTSETVYSHAFSPLISNVSNCNSKVLSTSNKYNNSSLASQVCMQDKNCAAFDWRGSTIDRQGNSAILNPPQTVFYSYVAPQCEEAIKTLPDDSKLLRNPIFIKGVGQPNSQIGDVYLDTATTDYYFFNLTTKTWIKQGSFAHSDFTSRNTINWGSILPTTSTQGVPGSIYVYYAANNPIYFHVYVKNPDIWKAYDPPLKGPGLIPDTPTNINVSGFTTIKHKDWLLYSSGTFLLVGILGSIIAFTFSRKSNKSD